MLRLTWSDFDAAVNVMVETWNKRPRDVSLIYGVPRGGLPIAVALSHRLGPPVALDLPSDLSAVLVVDDVIHTGKTFREYVVDRRAAHFWCWVSKNPEIEVAAALHLPRDDWLVFPWEDPARAEKDMKDYYNRR